MNNNIVIPDAAGYIVGWRLWLSTSNGLSSLVPLSSLYGDEVESEWPHKNSIMARCHGIDVTKPHVIPNDRHLCEHRASRETPPHKNGRCGVWAYKRKEDLLAESSNWIYHAIGQVALWGKCVEHELGWRSEFAYPLKVWMPRYFTSLTITQIAAFYNIPTIGGERP